MTRVTLIVLHVASAVVGFGAIALTGVYAGLARRRPDEAVRRYFRPGTNWAARAVYAVPVLGVVLVATSNGSVGYSQTWVWISLLLWVLAATLAHAVVWPGERRIQRLVAEAPPAATGDRQPDLGPECRRVQWAAVGIDVVFVAVMVLMVARPGGGG
jgi:uncharacterized membrane protein